MSRLALLLTANALSLMVSACGIPSGSQKATNSQGNGQEVTAEDADVSNSQSTNYSMELPEELGSNAESVIVTRADGTGDDGYLCKVNHDTRAMTCTKASGMALHRQK